jgi:hypothetical protein
MRQFFSKLCNIFTNAPVPALFDITKPNCLGTNALAFAIAGIILQQQDGVCIGVNGAVHSAKQNKLASRGN